MRVRAAQSTGVYWGVEEHLDRMYMYVRCMGAAFSCIQIMDEWRKEGGMGAEGAISDVTPGPRTT